MQLQNIELDDYVLFLRQEGKVEDTVCRRLGAGLIARPEHPEYMLWSTRLLSSLAEPMEEPNSTYEPEPQNQKTFFDDSILTQIKLI